MKINRLSVGFREGIEQTPPAGEQCHNEIVLGMKNDKSLIFTRVTQKWENEIF